MATATTSYGAVLWVTAILCVLAGCGGRESEPRYARFQMHSASLTHTVPDPLAGSPSPHDLALSEEPLDFLYAVGGVNGGVDEFHIIRIDSTGRCEYRFPDWLSGDHIVQMRTSFQLEKDELRELRKVLAENNFFRLPLAYETHAHDGTIVRIKCRFSSRTKEVACNNYFPTPVLNIHDVVMDSLLKRHTGEIQKAQPMPGYKSGLSDLLRSIENVQ